MELQIPHSHLECHNDTKGKTYKKGVITYGNAKYFC